MSERSLITAVLVASLASGAMALWRFGVVRDFQLIGEMPCDPGKNNCYIGGVDGSPTFYAVVSMPARTIAPCDARQDACVPLVCEDEGTGCTTAYCEGSGCFGGNQ